MESKEKAKELVDKYKSNVSGYYAIQKCALIAVDEILNLSTFKASKEQCLIHIKYWNKVKQEILKL